MTAPTTTLSCGSDIPVLGLGTWKSEPGEVQATVKEAIKIGYRHIDCAYIYMNEQEVGEALSDCFKEGLVKREDLFITSKLWNNSHRKVDVPGALETTLKNLGLEYIDMYLVHWPVALKAHVGRPKKPEDFLSLDEVPVSETWVAMEAVVEAGLCRGIGVSNFSVKKLKELLQTARIKPSINQVELHPYLQQQDLVDFCQQNGIHVTAYSPLGSMDRPALLKRDDELVILEDPVIFDIARTKSISPAQVLLSWAIQRGTSVIPKTVKKHRLVENLESSKITLSEEDMGRIKQLDKHRRYIHGSFWCIAGSPYTLASLWDE